MKTTAKRENAVAIFLGKVPAIAKGIGAGTDESGCWHVKFQIELDHPLAWRVVQELGHILNALSLEERLPTVFMPVSPPPYMNGGPEEFLSWVIESRDAKFTPEICAEWLLGRMPQPVESPEAWDDEEETDDADE